MPGLMQVSRFFEPDLPCGSPISLKRIAMLHRWEGCSIGTGYPRIADRYSAEDLIRMSGKKSYPEALEYFDLNSDGKTTLPTHISLRSLLSRHMNNGENKFRFLTYNTYLLKVKFVRTWVEKPLLDLRSTEIGKAVRDGFDIACLCEIFTEDIWDRVKQAWQAPLQYNMGENNSGVVCIAPDKLKGRIIRKDFKPFTNKGRANDSDWWANKGVLFTKIETGFGDIEIFSTHLFFGGGMPDLSPEELEFFTNIGKDVVEFVTGPFGVDVIPRESTPIERTKVKIDETKELLAFYQEHHLKENVAIIVGDFNIDANANFNRKYTYQSLTFYNIDEYNREYKVLKTLMAEHNFYDLWIWDVYQRMPNTGFTSRYTDDEPYDKDFSTCKSMIGDFCDDSKIDEPKHQNIGEGRLDYVFIQKPEASHTFNLDVSIPRRKAFKHEMKKDDEKQEFLSDHLGLSFDIIVSPKYNP